jgi:hypothetical protein
MSVYLTRKSNSERMINATAAGIAEKRRKSRALSRGNIRQDTRRGTRGVSMGNVLEVEDIARLSKKKSGEKKKDDHPVFKSVSLHPVLNFLCLFNS